MSYFEIYEPSAKITGTANVEIRVTQAKTGELRMDTGWHTVATEVQLKNGAIPIAAEMGIDKLSSGEYLLEVQASDSKGKMTVKNATLFVIE